MTEENKTQVPHVFTAVAAILKHLEVEKGGTLPANMGGKKYIPAPALAEEIKRQLVAQNLILLSEEQVVGQEAVINKDRLNIRVVVIGTYTLVSTIDGSNVSISGTGDGLATGTAVASNIASTNAQKNALLRTFLVSEEAVEEESMREAAAPQEKRSTAAAAKVAKKAPAKPAARGSKGSQETIRTEFIDTGVVTREQVNDLVSSVKTSDGLAGEPLFAEVLNRLRNGEVG